MENKINKTNRVVLNLTTEQAKDLLTVLKDSRCLNEYCNKVAARIEKTLGKRNADSFPILPEKNKAALIQAINEVIHEEAQKCKPNCYYCDAECYEQDMMRWYHEDQDDLVCMKCAKELKHTDTAYAGRMVAE